MKTSTNKMKTLTNRLNRVLAVVLATAALAVGQTVWAQSGPYADNITVDGVNYPRFMEFDAYDGTGVEYTYECNYYRYLVDGGWTTWAVEYAYAVEPFIEFDTKKPIIPKGYILTTSFYAQQHPNRNPKGWVLKGKRFPGDEWTTIDTQTDYELPAADHEDVIFKKPDNNNVYQYFRFEISKNYQSEDVVAYGHVVGKACITELCELQFYGSEYDTTHDLYYASFQNLRRYYPLNAVNLNYTVKNSAGTSLTKGTDYTETIRNSSNEVVTEITTVGTYTLTVTGINNYSGTLSSNFVVYEKLAGSGTQGDPYIIGDANQWQVFATLLNEGKNYMADYIKLADDFDNSDEPITLMASTSDNSDYWFQGHFDGNGRTLHIDLNAVDQDYCAPFRQTINADIHDLNVAGTITMTNGKKHAGSIVGRVHSGGTITNCHSTVTINDGYEYTHDGTHGGMVGLTQNYGTLAFTKCSFLGKILGSGNSCGGFVGWISDGCAISYNNCLFKPSELGNNVQGNSATFNRSGSGDGAGTSTFTDAYYFKDMNLGLVQGLEVSDTHPIERMYKKVIAADGNTYYSDEVYSYLYTHQRYRLTSGGAVQPLIQVTHGTTVLTEGTDYTIDYSHVNSTEAGSYPVIIAGKDNYGGYLMKTLNIASTFGMTVCENTEQSEYAPFRGLDLYEYQKTEFVIPASELTAMNGQTIKELKFHMTSSGSNWTNNFTLFVKEVDFTTFDSQSPAFSGTTDATQVFSGQPSVANQTVTFTFNNNYQYQGGNLLIGCYVENSSSWSDLSFYGKTVTGTSIHGRNTDSFDAVSATRHDFLPTVSFGYALVDLVDNADNKDVISNNSGAGKNVILSGRTLYKDGKWNTLCLPFAIGNATAAEGHHFDGTPLEGAELMELDTQAGSYEHQTGIDGSTLYLNFKAATSIVAGTPYIIKWASGDNLVNPVFTGVTIDDSAEAQARKTISFTGGSFVGSYDPFAITDGNIDEIIYLGSNNTIGYASEPRTLRPFRAHFEVPTGSGARAMTRTVVNFGDGETTGLKAIDNGKREMDSEDGAWYDLSGRRLEGKPSAKGVYIRNKQKKTIR